MKKNKKAGIYLIVAIALATIMGVALLLGKEKLQTNNIVDNTVENIVDNNPIEQVQYDEMGDFIFNDEDVEPLIKTIETLYGLSKTNLSNETLSLLKKISLESEDRETLLPLYYNSEEADYAAVVYALTNVNDNLGEVDCPSESGWKCEVISKASYEKIKGYYNLSNDSESFVKDKNGNYIVNFNTGWADPIIAKEYYTYKQGDNTVLLSIYKEYDEVTKEFLNSRIRIHTFKQKNGNYYLSTSQFVNSNIYEGYLNLALQYQNEEYSIGNYTLSFIGEKDDTQQDECYKYLLNIKYKNKVVNSKVFNNAKDYAIFSDNNSNRFNVYRVEDVYILVNDLATTGFNQSVIILNNQGNILKEYRYANMLIDNKEISIFYTTDTSTHCVVYGGPETNCKASSDVFTVSGNMLK